MIAGQNWWSRGIIPCNDLIEGSVLTDASLKAMADASVRTLGLVGAATAAAWDVTKPIAMQRIAPNEWVA